MGFLRIWGGTVIVAGAAAWQCRGPMATLELAGLRKSLLGWLTTADAAGLDEDGIVALFASALRDFYKRRSGTGERRAARSGEAEGVA